MRDMTTMQALVALHRAGRIKSPWLPGMRNSYDRLVEEQEAEQEGGS